MIKPTRGYVLISPEKAEEKTASGLYVPDNSQEKPQKGTVIAVGEAFLYSKALNGSIPAPCKDNDKVYYNRWASKDIKEDGKEYVIVKFEDVLGVIE